MNVVAEPKVFISYTWHEDPTNPDPRAKGLALKERLRGAGLDSGAALGVSVSSGWPFLHETKEFLVSNRHRRLVLDFESFDCGGAMPIA